jgi:hypothetical protein
MQHAGDVVSPRPAALPTPATCAANSARLSIFAARQPSIHAHLQHVAYTLCSLLSGCECLLG